MYPHERSLAERFATEPLVILGVNGDSDPDRVGEVIRAEGMTWDSFFDGGCVDGPIAVQWNVRAWPTTYLIDHKGIIRYVDVYGQDLEEAVSQLVTEASGSGVTDS
jgi:hypothetical protein